MNVFLLIFVGWYILPLYLKVNEFLLFLHVNMFLIKIIGEYILFCFCR